jgi:hypothetical protein
MSPIHALLQLHDLDQLLQEARDQATLTCLRRLGLAVGDPRPVEVARRNLLRHVDARWMHHYERARLRYGGAVAAVRGRVCQGCHMALPRSASPGSGEALTLCESCGRILYWAVREPA